MIEIKFCGRGGQGVVVASQMLGVSLFRAGMYPQCYSVYGGERRGAPVVSFLRIDKEQIRLKCEIRRADEMIYFEPSLIKPDEVRALMEPGGRILVGMNGSESRLPELAEYTVARVDARGIAETVGLGRMVNTAMLGAYCRFSGHLALETLVETIAESVPAKTEANIEAVRRGFAELHVLN